MRRRTTAVLLGGLLAFSVTGGAEARAPSAFFGVVPQAPPRAVDFKRMDQGRVGTLRYVVGWSTISPTADPAEADWRELDYVVGHAAEHGIVVLPSIFGTPAWVSGLEGCEHDCPITPPQTAEGLSAWRALFAALATRYGPGGEFWRQHPELPETPIRAWQIWNEPNSPMYYGPRPDPFGYAVLVAHSAIALKAVDPGAQVILGGMFGFQPRRVASAQTAWEFLRHLYAIGLDPYFDGAAVHPYGAKMRRVITQVERMRRVVRAKGSGPTGLWITEIGWTTAGDTPLNRGPRGQAERFAQLLRYGVRNRARLGLRLIAWFAWRDVPRAQARCGWCAWAGLFADQGFRPKPAWHAFTRFTGGR